MRASTHLAIGVGAGIAAVAVLNWMSDAESKPMDFVFGGVVGGLAGLLPDVLEPATSPHHRSTMHSVPMLGLLAYSAWKLRNSESLPPKQKQLFMAILSGYGSHLMIDATTPMGLPLI